MRRRLATVFRTVVAPSFARCHCGAQLVGRRCWHWHERDGSPAYGCRLCTFSHAQINPAQAAD